MDLHLVMVNLINKFTGSVHAIKHDFRLASLSVFFTGFYSTKEFMVTECHQHLRVEENPIMQIPHLEAACILLYGPTLKKFNDRGKM